MKLSKNFSSAVKGVEYGPRLRPSRDWLVILLVAFTLLILSIVLNLWMFARVTEGEGIGEAPPANEPKTVPVETVNRVFEKRALEEGRYRSEYRFVDPSR